MPYWMADKAFQIFYVLIFTFGFRYLVRSIRSENAFLSLLFFPFLFTVPFQQGFYNYCISLAFMFWTVGFYLRYKREISHPMAQLGVSLLLLMTALSHGMPAIYTMFIICLLWFGDNQNIFKIRKVSAIIEGIARVTLIFLPSLLLILMFMAKRGTGTVPHAWSWQKKLIEFAKMWTSQSTRDAEVYPAVAAGILILVTFILGIFLVNKRLYRREHISNQWKKSGVVMLIMAAFCFFSYITAPHSIGGAGSIDIRLAFLPPMFLLLFAATRNWGDAHRFGFCVASIIISLSFLFIRFPYILEANEIGKDIMSANKFIGDESVVLNLHYDDWQLRPEGDSIFQKDNSFLHFSDYYGAEKDKHLIMLMNYEADINYFPVNWAAGKNPRNSIEGMYAGTYPPEGSIAKYEQQIDRKVDYVLQHNWQEKKSNLPQNIDFQRQMDSMGFVKVHITKRKGTIVWKRNP